ncbi:MAG: hypothetical protein AAF714_05225 [Pseudomonadota bacterium]
MTRILAFAAIGAIAVAGCTRVQEQGDLPVRDGPQVEDPSSGFRVISAEEAATTPSGSSEDVTLGEDLLG